MSCESRNTEDRIRELCAKAAAAESPNEVNEILSQLRAALREHIANIKDMIAEYHRLGA
jgi:hypothetical protein